MTVYLLAGLAALVKAFLVTMYSMHEGAHACAMNACLNHFSAAVRCRSLRMAGHGISTRCQTPP